MIRRARCHKGRVHAETRRSGERRPRGQTFVSTGEEVKRRGCWVENRVGVTLCVESALSRDPQILSRRQNSNAGWLKVIRRTTLLVPIVLFSGVVTLGAATQPKFRPSSVGGAGVGRYVVTLTEEAGFEDPAALRQELAQLYGAKLEVTASYGGRQFALTMTYARARLLSSDPRVIEVAEVPPTIAAPTPAASRLPRHPISHLGRRAMATTVKAARTPTTALAISQPLAQTPTSMTAHSVS